MAEITWKNVSDAGQNTALGHRADAVSAFNTSINDLAKVGTDTIDMYNEKKLLTDQEATRLNTAYVNNLMANIQTPEQMKAFQQSGMGNAGQLTSVFGNKLDLANINQNVGNLASTTYDRALSNNKSLDYTEAGLKANQDLAKAYASGNIAEVNRILASGNVSNTTALNAGEKAYGIYRDNVADAKDNRNFNWEMTKYYQTRDWAVADDEKHRKWSLEDMEYNQSIKDEETLRGYQATLATAQNTYSTGIAQMNSLITSNHSVISQQLQEQGIEPTQENIHTFMMSIPEYAQAYQTVQQAQATGLQTSNLINSYAQNRYSRSNNGSNGGNYQGQSSGEIASNLLKELEGFSATAYDDVGSLRIGYGSDTITKADGSMEKVTQGMRVSKEDAQRDLTRRLNGEFAEQSKRAIGASAYDKLSPAQQAGIQALAYRGDIYSKKTPVLKQLKADIARGDGKFTETIKRLETVIANSPDSHKDGLANRFHRIAQLLNSSGSTQQGQQKSSNSPNVLSKEQVASSGANGKRLVGAGTVARANAANSSKGLCARYVRQALDAKGIRIRDKNGANFGSAYQYHTSGALREQGFQEVKPNGNFQAGDIIVIDRFQGKEKNRKHGHIAIFDGQNWISDFIQKSKDGNIYNDTPKDKIHYYRHSDVNSTSQPSQASQSNQYSQSTQTSAPSVNGFPQFNINQLDFSIFNTNTGANGASNVNSAIDGTVARNNPNVTARQQAQLNDYNKAKARKEVNKAMGGSLASQFSFNSNPLAQAKLVKKLQPYQSRLADADAARNTAVRKMTDYSASATDANIARATTVNDVFAKAVRGGDLSLKKTEANNVLKTGITQQATNLTQQAKDELGNLVYPTSGKGKGALVNAYIARAYDNRYNSIADSLDIPKDTYKALHIGKTMQNYGSFESIVGGRNESYDVNDLQSIFKFKDDGIMRGVETSAQKAIDATHNSAFVGSVIASVVGLDKDGNPKAITDNNKKAVINALNATASLNKADTDKLVNEHRKLSSDLRVQEPMLTASMARYVTNTVQGNRNTTGGKNDDVGTYSVEDWLNGFSKQSDVAFAGITSYAELNSGNKSRAVLEELSHIDLNKVKAGKYSYSELTNFIKKLDVYRKSKDLTVADRKLVQRKYDELVKKKQAMEYQRSVRY